MEAATIDVRPELPEMPARIALLPVHRGYPVPWFVCWMDDAGEPCRRGTGTPDFRILAPDAIARAHNDKLCWVCGKPRGVHLAFVGGPMCAISRTVSEPPAHRECATWSVRACPFLSRPHAKRREGGIPEGAAAAGIMLLRNPGASFVWMTRNYFPFAAPGGVLFQMDDPAEVEWYQEGRPATRAEVEASIEDGLPALMEIAEQQEGAVEDLNRRLDECKALLPA